MRMKKKVFLAALVAAVGVVAAPQPLDLNGSWEFRFEEGKSWKEADPAFAATDRIVVPGCFDALPKWFMKRGTGHYRRTFTLDAPVENAWLVVDGLGLYGTFRIDGRNIGTDALPWSRVEIPTGPLAAGEHTLFAAVDNRFDWSYQKLVRTYYDFHCWGGFFHGVSLAFDNRKLFVRTRDYRTGTVEIEAVNFKAAARLSRCRASASGRRIPPASTPSPCGRPTASPSPPASASARSRRRTAGSTSTASASS